MASTGMSTRELHGPGYYHVGRADACYAMYEREDEDPQRKDSPTFGSSQRGSNSQDSCISQDWFKGHCLLLSHDHSLLTASSCVKLTSARMQCSLRAASYMYPVHIAVDQHTLLVAWTRYGTGSLSLSFTHRDNPHGNSNHRMNELIEADR